MSQKELDKKLQLLYVIDRKKKDAIISNIPKENQEYKSFVERIYSKSSEEILLDIKNKVDELTPEFMNEQICGYNPELYSDGCIERYNAQIKWLSEFANDFEEIEQLLQICRLFKRIGININVAQASHIWIYISDNACAQWLGKEEDNITWWKILTDWVYNQKEELK